jgi:hypothetical protein
VTEPTSQMENHKNEPQREILPIPHRSYTDLISYHAKDPDASFSPIDPLRPPEGAPNVLVVLLSRGGDMRGRSPPRPPAPPHRIRAPKQKGKREWQRYRY